MASVQEMLLAAQAKKSPFISLLEGVAQGGMKGWQDAPSRQKAQFDLAQEKEAAQRNQEMHDELIMQIRGGNEQADKARVSMGAPKGTSAMPGPRIKEIALGKDGLLKPTLKVDEPKSLQKTEYYDKAGVKRQGRFDPATGTYDQRPDDPVVPETAEDRRGQARDRFQYQNQFIHLKEVKDYNEVRGQVERMRSILKSNTNPDTKSKVGIDQALISIYNKINDPGSVVRESEYARTPEGMAVLNRIVGQYEKYKQGGTGLSDVERNQLVRDAMTLADATGAVFNERRQEYQKLATELGYGPETFVGTIRPHQSFTGGQERKLSSGKTVKVKR